jgi:hypothetical protein
MSKPIYRREVQATRRFAKQRSLLKATEEPYLRINIHHRLRAQAERLMAAVDQSQGRYA